LSRSWLDVYQWGEKMSWLAKSAQKKYKSADERGDELMCLAWSESMRKHVKETVSIALVILKVEEVVKTKRSITA